MNKQYITFLGRRINRKDVVQFLALLFILGMMQLYRDRYHSVKQDQLPSKMVATYAIVH